MLTMCEDIKYQYLYDFLSIVLGKKINLDKESLHNIILSEIKQILKEIIDCDEYDMINVFINYVGIEAEKIIHEIYQIQNNCKSYIKFELIEWMYKNNIELFKIYINSIMNNKTFYYLINDFNILQLFYNIIICSQNSDFIEYKNLCIEYVVKIFTNSYYTQNINNVFINFEHLELIIDICLLDDEFGEDEFSYNIIDCVLKNQLSNIKILKKTIQKLNLTSEEIKIHLDNKKSIIINHNEINFLEELIKSKSIDKIRWFLDIITDYSKFINKKNYIRIFSIACETSNIEISKYIYNIIQICGFEMTKQEMITILNRIIFSSRWNESTDREQIIFELINFGIKPPSGYPKYTEYYNNLKIYSKN